MITAHVGNVEAFDDILAMLRRAQDIDLAPLAARIAAIVGDDIRARLAAGRTADGAGFAPLAGSTLKHHRGSTVPGGDLGSTVTVDIDVQPDRVAVTAGWAGQQATKAQFFSEGTSRMPARSLQGISPDAESKINRAIDDFLRAALGGR